MNRKLDNFLSLKNSPVLNKYNFTYKDNKLTLMNYAKKVYGTFDTGKI